MKKNLLNQYVLGLLESIERNLSQYVKDKKPDRLHQLRVGIKKIRGVFAFSEKVYNEPYKAVQLKPLFDKAGEIREIQINMHLLNQFPKAPKKLIEQLTKKETILTRKFIAGGSQYAKHIHSFRKTVSLPCLLPDIKTINNYFKTEKRKATRKLKTKKREDAHRYRIKIKKLLYAYQALPKSLQKEIKFNVTTISRRQEELGYWHDTYSAIQFLTDQPLPASAADYVLKLKQNEKKQFNNLFN